MPALRCAVLAAVLCSLAACALVRSASAAGDTLYTRVEIKDAVARGAVCTDGTPGIYYVHLQDAAQSSGRWVLYLMGGGGCSDKAMCQERSRDFPYLVSSKVYGAQANMSNMLSADPSVNPGLANSSFVHIVFCSSDWWSGDGASDGFQFRGRRIVDAVLADLLETTNIRAANQVVLAGSSAGGVGVLVHVDEIGDWVRRELGARVAYSAIMDSGVFLGGKSLRDWPCTSTSECNQDLRFVWGMTYWNATPNVACVASVSAADKHRCMEATFGLKYVRTPTLQTLFSTDLWQALQDGITGAPENFTKIEVDWVLRRGNELLDGLKALKWQWVWSAACFYHVISDSPFYATLRLSESGLTAADAVAKFVHSPAPIQAIDTCTTLDCTGHCPE